MCTHSSLQTGFYAVYENVFSEIIWGDENSKSECPPFGNSKSEYKSVEVKAHNRIILFNIIYFLDNSLVFF